MHIRCDYVTNSSSSLFILARSHTLNELQKEAILDYVMYEFLGMELLDPDSPEEDTEFVFGRGWELGRREDVKAKAEQALADGLTLTAGRLDYGDMCHRYADIYEEIWNLPPSMPTKSTSSGSWRPRWSDGTGTRSLRSGAVHALVRLLSLAVCGLS